MAKIHYLSAYMILLALFIACHAILSTEGRQIKPTKAKKEILPPPISYEESAAAYKDGFRPTTPGNSPGIGHSRHTQDNEDVESKVVSTAAVAGHSVAGFVDDFRPTTPGHSPGIGHFLVKKNVEPKA